MNLCHLRNQSAYKNQTKTGKFMSRFDDVLGHKVIIVDPKTH